MKINKSSIHARRQPICLSGPGILFMAILILIFLLSPSGSIFAQAGSSNFKLSAGGCVGGGGEKSLSASAGLSGSVPLTGVGYATSSSFRLNAGINEIASTEAAFAATYEGTKQMVVTAGVAHALRITVSSSLVGTRSGVFYRRFGGESSYISSDMTVLADTLSFSLAGDSLNIRGLDYYFKIKIGSDSLFIGEPSDPYVFKTELIESQFMRSTAMPDAKYRIIGVPIVIASGSVVDVFQDDLGAPSNTKWRLGSYNTSLDSVIEFPDAADVAPGKGYWLIARGGKKYGSPGTSVYPTRTIVPDRYYEVPLALGWNQLANPFAFEVSWDEVRFDDNGAVVTGHPISVLDDVAYWYNGSAYEQKLTIPAWEGVFVNIKKAGIKALIPYHAVAATPKSDPSSDPGSSKNLWAVNLKLEVNGLVDDNNLAGVRAGASIGADNYDFSEPPPPPDGPRLAFRLPDGDKHLRRLDLRPPFEDGAGWDVEFSRASGGILTFGGMNQIPEGMQVWLKMGSGSVIKIIDGTSLPIPESVKSARLIIGTEEYVSREGIGSLPTNFSIEQNFPNPFNPTTRIDYSLPAPGHVRLEILNILGQRVKLLTDSEMPAGRHIAVWNGDGEDHAPAASGVYFYRIAYDKYNKIRKMLLLK